MNEWTVVSVIIALVGLFITVGKPIINLNNTMTTLNVTMQQHDEEIKKHDKKLEKQAEDAHTSHQKLWDKNDEQDAKLGDHETRLSILENMPK